MDRVRVRHHAGPGRSPGNRSPARAALLGIALVIASAVLAPPRARAAAADEEPNDFFAEPSTLLDPGITSVLGTIVGPSQILVLGVFDDQDQFVDHSEAAFPADPTSAVVNSDGTLRLRVTGVDSFETYNVDPAALFEPPLAHTQTGDFQLRLDFLDAEGDPIPPSLSLPGSVSPGELVSFALQAGNQFPAQAVEAEASLLVDYDLNADRVDFQTFNGLNPGAPYTVSITSTDIDVNLGIFDSNGGFEFDGPDPDGMVPFTISRGTSADASGRIWVGVTEFADSDFIGFHLETGSYELRVEPAGVAVRALPTGGLPWLAALLLGAALLVGRDSPSGLR